MHMIINSKKYEIPEIDFNFICETENKGVSLFSMEDKPLGVLRAFLATCMDTDAETAGKEIEEHLIKGGNLEVALESMTEALEKSNFFQKLVEREEQAEEKKGKSQKK